MFIKQSHFSPFSNCFRSFWSFHMIINRFLSCHGNVQISIFSRTLKGLICFSLNHRDKFIIISWWHVTVTGHWSKTAHIFPSWSLFTPELQYDLRSRAANWCRTFESITHLSLCVNAVKKPFCVWENIIWCVAYFCRNVGHPHPLRNSPALTSAFALFQRETAQIWAFFYGE